MEVYINSIDSNEFKTWCFDNKIKIGENIHEAYDKYKKEKMNEFIPGTGSIIRFGKGCNIFLTIQNGDK